uniref:Uncharacterized protein n=1 Tax=Oryza nivara TaxID=4536 RepID=A0A0E0FHA6_ORYNI
MDSHELFRVRPPEIETRRGGRRRRRANSRRIEGEEIDEESRARRWWGERHTGAAVTFRARQLQSSIYCIYRIREKP